MFSLQKTCYSSCSRLIIGPIVSENTLKLHAISCSLNSSLISLRLVVWQIIGNCFSSLIELSNRQFRIIISWATFIILICFVSSIIMWSVDNGPLTRRCLIGYTSSCVQRCSYLFIVSPILVSSRQNDALIDWSISSNTSHFGYFTSILFHPPYLWSRFYFSSHDNIIWNVVILLCLLHEKWARLYKNRIMWCQFFQFWV